MRTRLRIRPISFFKCAVAVAVGAMAVWLGSVYSDSIGGNRRPLPSAADSELLSSEESPFDAVEADVDGVAKSKIEILKKQGEKKQSVSVKAANHVPAFDARAEASAAMSRLIVTRKCERMAGSIIAGQHSGISSSCPINHPLASSSPSGYSDLLTQQTVNELAFLKQLTVYARSERQSDPFDLVQVAKAYIQHPDDNVKEQALEIAALMSARDGKEALKVASKAMESTVSGPLALQALSLLSLHRDHDPRLVDETVTAALKDGGWHVRDAIASQLLPFITPSTKEDFIRILEREPARSKVALHIRLNLEEFDRMERL